MKGPKVASPSNRVKVDMDTSLLRIKIKSIRGQGSFLNVSLR